MWNDKPTYLPEIPHIWGCARPDCQQAEHRPFWLVYTMHPLQTWEARASETMFKKAVLNTDKTPHWVKTQHKIKYLHSEEAAQTSHSQCLDTPQPLEEIKHRLKTHKPNIIMRQKIYKEQVDERLTLWWDFNQKNNNKKTGQSVKLTTSVMFRIFLVMVSLSWAGVGVNHNFWNVSFTNFYKEEKLHH